MTSDALKEAIQLIKAGKKLEARKVLEPFIVANPNNIQAWVWEIETRESDAEKLRVMETCLVHNPDSEVIHKAFVALKTRIELQGKRAEGSEPFTTLELFGLEPTPSGEKTVSETKAIKMSLCPQCSNPVKVGELICGVCGREILTDSDVETETPGDESNRKPWYRLGWVKVMFFILLNPIWAWIELTDQEMRVARKVIAGVLLVLFLNLLSLLIYWAITTHPASADLFNWARYLVGQEPLATPAQILSLRGTVARAGETPFNGVEIQVRVYDEVGNLIGINSTSLNSIDILPGAPAIYTLDVPKLEDTLNGSLANAGVIWFDDFSDPLSGWRKADAPAGSTGYIAGRYEIFVNLANYDLWANPGKKFTDSKVEVDAISLSGEASDRFGIQCRYNDPGNNYFAVISSDGFYGIGKVSDGIQSFLNESGMEPSNEINLGDAVNHIRFDCIGDRLSLYVNGDFVDSVVDEEFSSGDAGLIAGTFENIGTHIAFDNFIIANP